MGEVSTRDRKVVYARDWDCCVRCGRRLADGNRQCQHRVPRGMGGRALASPLSHLVLLCGFSATDPAGCHHWAESQPIAAQAVGLVVPDGVEPTLHPVQYSLTHGGGWWLLDDDGDRRQVG